MLCGQGVEAYGLDVIYLDIKLSRDKIVKALSQPQEKKPKQLLISSDDENEDQIS